MIKVEMELKSCPASAFDFNKWRDSIVKAYTDARYSHEEAKHEFRLMRVKEVDETVLVECFPDVQLLLMKNQLEEGKTLDDYMIFYLEKKVIDTDDAVDDAEKYEYLDKMTTESIVDPNTKLTEKLVSRYVQLCLDTYRFEIYDDITISHMETFLQALTTEEVKIDRSIELRDTGVVKGVIGKFKFEMIPTKLNEASKFTVTEN